jgi:hypothetical protein
MGPYILWVDILEDSTNGRASCYFYEFPCVSTLQGSIVGSRCSVSFILVWDPRIIISFSLVQFFVPMGVMALLEDKQSLGREDCNVPIFGFPCFTVGGDLMGLCQLGQRGKWRLTGGSVNWRSYMRPNLVHSPYFIIRITSA